MTAPGMPSATTTSWSKKSKPRKYAGYGGNSKREKAQALIVKAPDILDGIMNDPAASPRHRVDAIRTLDNFAANAPGQVAQADRFSIVINLGGPPVEVRQEPRGRRQRPRSLQ